MKVGPSNSVASFFHPLNLPIMAKRKAAVKKTAKPAAKRSTKSTDGVDGFSDLALKAGEKITKNKTARKVATRLTNAVNPRKVRLQGYNDGSCENSKGQLLTASECGAELSRMESTYYQETAISGAKYLAIGLGALIVLRMISGSRSD